MRAPFVLAALVLSGCAAAPTAPVAPAPAPASRYALQAVAHEVAHVVQQREGAKLVAHEAAHVVQQRGGLTARVWRGRGRGLQPFTAAWSDATGHFDLWDGKQAATGTARRKARRGK